MLPKDSRLTKRTDFEKVARGSRPTHSKYLILKKSPNPNHKTKFGIVISTKVSKKAVVRNKIRRRIREVLRSNLSKIKPDYKVILVVKNTVIDKDYQELKQDLETILKKASLL